MRELEESEGVGEEGESWEESEGVGRRVGGVGRRVRELEERERVGGE